MKMKRAANSCFVGTVISKAINSARRWVHNHLQGVLPEKAHGNCATAVLSLSAKCMQRGAHAQFVARSPNRVTVAGIRLSKLAFAALAAVGIAVGSPSAHAQFATGGTGLYKPSIFWVDFGNNGDNVYNGATVTRGFNIDTPASPANRLDITCTISGATATRGTQFLYVYTPGNWQGDGLDELYNIGGNQPGTGANPNTLSIGLRNNNGSTIEFNFACSATLGGSPISLSGLVFADAEASGGPEYVAARLTGGGTLRVIDQISQCGASGFVNVIAGPPQEVRFQGSSSGSGCEFSASPAQRAGPALVGFIQGATNTRIIVNGSGVSAVALGAVIDLEFSEAIPNSYGVASHVLSSGWLGGVATTGVNYNNPANLATRQISPPYLGTTVVPDADANGPIGGSDVDALPKTTGPLGAGYANVAAPSVVPGSTYAIPNVTCTGPGSVAGWIDFNGNGVFDAGEKSTVATCPSGVNTVSLSWTIPADYKAQTTSYMRLRAATTAAGVANPTGPTNGGEAEDYRIVLPNSADMQATVTGFPTTAAAGTTVTGTVTCTNNGQSAAATATCAVSGAPAGATVSCVPATPVASLAMGSSIACSVSYTAPSLGGTVVTVTGTAGSSTADPLATNNTASQNTTVTAQADMKAATAAPATVNAGQSVTVSGTCTNAGASAAVAPTCALSGLPAGATQSCTPSPVPDPLPLNSAITCTSTFTAPATGPLTITTTAGSTTPDPVTNNNTDTKPITIVPQADMAAAVSGFPANANAGSTVTGTVTCTNNGPSAAATATCVPTGLPAGATVTCTPASPAASLAVGASISCAVSYTAPASGAVTVTGTAGSATADPVSGNNTVQASTTIVPQADMAAAVSGFPATANAGSTVTGTVTCTNNGPSAAATATCVPTGLPAGATVTCTPASPAASLAVGASISCAVSYTAPASGTVTVTGTAGTATADPVSGNNTAQAATSITPQADMQAVTTVPASANAGQSVTVSGVCTNAGPSTAAAPTCALTGLPAGATQSCTPNPAPNPLALGASITCTSTFTAPGTGPLNITTTAGSTTADPVPANNANTKPLVITPQADMAATVSGFPNNPPAGSTATGTVTCINNGPSPATAPTCSVASAPAGATAVCTPNPAPDPLPVGASITCSVSYNVPASGGITVTGTAGSATADPNNANNSAQAATSVVPQADVSAVTTVPASVNAGQPVTVSGVCTNAGPSGAAAPTCALSGLPPGATQSCTPDPAPNPLAVGSSITCTSTFTAPASGSLDITTTAGTTTADPNNSNNTDTKTIPIIPQADMAAAVSGFPANANAGSTVTGTVTCTNNGPSTAATATCVPTGLPAGATVTCTPASPAASLAVGASISCAVSYTAPASGAVTVTGTAGSATADPVSGNNTVQASTTIVPQADMAATVNGFPSNPPAGSTVTGTVTCINNGPSVAATATCVPTGLPAGATVTCTPASPVASLAVGSTISCAVSYTAPASGSVTVTGTAGSATADPNSANNSAQVATAVVPQADMGAVTTVPASANAGQSVSVSGTCTNAGPSAAAAPTCALSGLPAGATQSCIPNPAPDPLAVGASITCTSTFTAPASGSLNITTTAGSTTADPNNSNNTDTKSLPITPQADMAATVSGFPSNPPAGSTVTGTVTCTNNGPSAAANADCVVTGLPPGASVSCVPAAPTSSLGVGATISCAVSYTAPASGSVTVTGTAGSSTADPNPANNAAQQTASIVPQADMRAATTVPASANAGQSVSVSGTCTNAGPSAAAAPTCALSGLPAGATQSCTPNPVPNPLAVGASITCTSTFTAPASGPLNITTTAGSTTADPNNSNNTDTKPFVIVPQADMAAVATGFPASANAGDPVNGTVTCTNNGPSAAFDAVCGVSSIPVAGVTVVCTPSPVPNPLPVGASISCAVSYTAPVNGAPLTITGTASSSVADPSPANNTAQATTNTVPQADLVAAVSAPSSVNAGQSVTVSGTCTNSGPSAADSVSCALTGLPTGAVQSCTPSPVPNPLPVGSAVTCTSTFIAPAAGPLNVGTSASALMADPAPTNNTAPAVIAIVPQADMAAAVSGFPASPNAGTSVNGTVTCTNNGPSIAASATCAVSGAPPGASVVCSPASPVGALGVGASISCEVSFIAPVGGGTLTITGTAGSATADPVPTNNVASTNSTVVLQADMQGTVTGLPTNPLAGSTVTGTLTCTNAGPSAAANASCTPSGLPAGASVTCTPPSPAASLAVGARISCAVSFTAPPSGTLNVGVTAASATADPISGNNAAGQLLSVSPVADMAAALSGFPTNAVAGATVSGTLTCTNNGPSAAANATCGVSGLPAGASVVCTPGSPVASLAAGSSITCSISYTVAASGAVSISGNAGSSTQDPNSANNLASTTTGVIDAVNDTAVAPVNGAAGGVAISNVLVNDTLNGSPATVANVSLTQTATTNPGVTLDPATGAVNVAPGTPAGSYTVNYQICTKTTPAVCDSAVATVQVSAAPIDAVNDPQVLSGSAGITVNVLANDTLNGAPVVATSVTPSLTNNGGINGLTLGANGNLVVPPNTPPGVYTVTYQICEKLNPANCDTATVPVVVQGPLTGSVWLDAGTGATGVGAADRQRSPGESGLEGWTVEVVFPPGSPQAGQVATLVGGQPATALTDANGQYQIAGLAPGNYQLRFRAPGVAGAPGPVHGNPANGEQNNPQAGSSVNAASRALDITMPAGAGLAQQGLPVDPSGVLYDSVTRAPVTNATVTLIGPNGQPVPDDQLLPGQQGQAVVPSGPSAGTYRFDLLPTAPAGVYTLRVSPSAAYNATSTLIPPQATAGTPGSGTLCPGATAGNTCPVQTQAGAPPVGAATTYYLSFNLNPANSPDVVHNHIPLDPVLTAVLAIIKTADKSEAEIGDPVKYTIRVKNLSTTSPVPAVKVEDVLPLGFKYVAKTTRRVGTPPTVLPEPTGAPGPRLTFDVGTLAANAETSFTYYVRVDIGSADGDGINRATAVSGPVRSLTAQAKVKVRGGVLGAEACIVGKVFADCGANGVGYGNGNGIQDPGEPGMPGVRLYLQDGSYVITDSEGKYSLCGLAPRTHVLKVDPITLPKGARLGTTSNRNAGDPGSLFVDVKNGQLQRADFRDMSCNASVLEELERRRDAAPKEQQEDVNRPAVQGDGQPGAGLGLPTAQPGNRTGATAVNPQAGQEGGQ